MRWIAILMMITWSTAVWAQSDTEADRVSIRLGAFYLYDSDTDLAIRSTDAPIGTSVNLQRDFDVEEDASSWLLAGYYRFNPHHRIELELYNLDRDGSRNTNREIVFRDEVFEANANLKTDLDLGMTKLAYTWSFHHSDDVELGLSVGAVVLDYEVDLRRKGALPVDQLQAVSVKEDVTAPVPVFGLRLDYTITPAWHVLFDYDNFYLEIDNDIQGSLNNTRLSLEYKPFDNVFFGVGASNLSLDLQIEDDDRRWNLGDMYRGVQLYAGYRF